MELNFTEIDDLDKKSYGNVDVNNNKSTGFKQPKYWEKTKKNNDMPKKKKVSFDKVILVTAVLNILNCLNYYLNQYHHIVLLMMLQMMLLELDLKC